MFTRLFVVLLLLGLGSPLAAQQEVLLWEKGAPGTEGRPNEEEVVNERVRKVYQPTLTAHLPPRELASGTAVLVCPGGGYRHLAIFKEGHQIADWLNTLGLAAFVLKYRLNPGEALEDAQRAMRLIRAQAEDWGVDRGRVGAMGFSAGGHLVANLLLNGDDGVSDSPDTVEALPSRPDFLVPVYVWVGDLDLEGGIESPVPPTFLVGASDDKTTEPTNSIGLYQALLGSGGVAELHLFERGGHGFGLGKGKGLASWTVLCENWMRLRGLIE